MWFWWHKSWCIHWVVFKVLVVIGELLQGQFCSVYLAWLMTAVEFVSLTLYSCHSSAGIYAWSAGCLLHSWQLLVSICSFSQICEVVHSIKKYISYSQASFKLLVLALPPVQETQHTGQHLWIQPKSGKLVRQFFGGCFFFAFLNGKIFFSIFSIFLKKETTSRLGRSSVQSTYTSPSFNSWYLLVGKGKILIWNLGECQSVLTVLT